MSIESSLSSTTNEREWDLVVYGATGDAGMAIAMYIANNLGTYKKKSSNRFRWAIAGRSELKLNRIRSRIIVGRLKPSANDEIGVLTADAASVDDMSELAKSTRVLISAVGPYTVLGESAYKACAEHGTNYVDITGEVDWVGSMRGKYRNRAKETGSTLCSFAGYDSVPCDITMHLARKTLSECDNDGGSTIISSAEMVWKPNGGVFPRGTIRTTISKLPEGLGFCGKLVRYPFNGSKNGGIHWKTARALVQWLLPKWSPEYGAFTIPHFMGWCNIPVIYNSYDSSIDCIYHDRWAVPYSKDCPATGYGLLQTFLLYVGVVLFSPFFLLLQGVAVFIPSSAVLLLRLFDSFQYRGNSKSNQQQLNNATTDVWNYATSSTGSKVTVHLHVKGDAGIKCTAMLAAETAFSMLVLLDKNELPKGLIGSPSEIVGDTLVERLQDDESIGHSCSLTVTVVNNYDRSSKKED